MTNNANPSMNPADNDTLVGLFRLVLRKFLSQTDDMLPAKVIAFDRETNRVTVQPMIQVVSTNGQAISRAPVVSVPVMNLGGGGFVLSFPLQPGDLGWIKASDRDLSIFLQAYSETRPNTGRMHSFSDALFIPDVMRGWTVDDPDAAVLQSLDGTVSVALGAGTLTLTAPVVVIASAAASVTGDLTVDGAIIGGTVADATGTMDLMRTQYNAHNHPGGAGQPANPQMT